MQINEPLLAHDEVLKQEKCGALRFSVNTMKVFLGAGILTMPFGMKQAGLVTGAVTLAALSYISVSCMLLVVECKNAISQGPRRSNRPLDADSLSFGALADVLLGPRGKLWADITVVFTQLAFGTAYIIYAGKNCSLVAQTYGYSFHFIGLDADIVLMIAAAAAIAPFALLRSMRALAPVSSFALIALCYGVVCIAYYSIQKIAQTPPVDLPLTNWKTFPIFFGNSLYMFEGVGLVVPLEMSMKDPSKFRFMFSLIVYLFSIFCMAIGVLGFSAFGDMVEGSITNALPSSIPVAVLRVFYSLGLLFSVPIQFFPAFEILELSLEGYQRRMLTNRTVVSLRLCVCVFCTFVAILCRNYFGYFTSIIGSIGCSALLFIFPAFFHLNAFKYALTPALYARNYAIIALGIVLGCASFALSVIDIVNGESG